jgi:hypothetical protein
MCSRFYYFIFIIASVVPQERYLNTDTFKIESCLWQKVKFVPVLNEAPRREDVMWRRDIAPRILDVGTRWRLVVSFMTRQLYPRGKNTRFSLDRSVGGLQILN